MAERPENTASGQSPESPRTEVSPRAFAVGTGLCCQAVGLVFLLGSCCVWSLSANVVEPSPEPAERRTDDLVGDRLPAAVLMIGLAVTLVGGMALVAVGTGLQGERPSSGILAMVVTGLMTGVYAASAVLLIVHTGSVMKALAPVLPALATSILFLLAGYSASVLRRFPPPPDQSVATPEFLEACRQEREERLKRSNP